MVICKSFKPSINKNSKILILGSMPGIKSLEEQQYYAHPQNRFWKLMGLICKNNELHKLNYNDKLNTLLDHKIALWDVIASCDRNGSLDSNITNIKPNDILKLVQEYKIEKICLNGNKAFTTFKKFFPKMLDQYNCYKLPSTSPANATYSIDNLYEEWKKLLLDKA